MLTGPVTILNWSFPREDLPLREIAFQIALAIRDEVADLEKAGIKIIQVDEAALREKLPLKKENWHGDYLDWAVKAFRIASSPVRPETQIQTHMCYSEFSDIMESIKEMDADVLLIEAAKSDFSVLDSLRSHEYDKCVGPGVYDIHSPRVPGEDEMAGMISLMTEKFDAGSLWVNPDCGLKTRRFEETIPSLENMVRAAKRVRDTVRQ
jgi:5-methyltetrahydropteroyltriglutamate--homocysteine methyltransferase